MPHRWMIRTLQFLMCALIGALCATYYSNKAQQQPALVTQSQQMLSWSRANALHAAQAAPLLNDDLDQTSLLQALEHSINYYEKLNARLQFGERAIDASFLLAKYRLLASKLSSTLSKQELFDFISSNFLFSESADPKPLITGYYEPLLNGSLTRTEKYFYPLYRRPNDLLEIHLGKFFDVEKFSGLPRLLYARLNERYQLIPYYSRAEIDSESALKGRKLELCWVDDQIDAFFLQIQGSGVVALANGSELIVNYAGANGLAYRALGTELVKRGLMQLADVNMHSIKAYLRQHPEQLQSLLNTNPSYVFFKQGESGARGNLGEELTAGRSIATDQTLLPAGALAYIETSLPSFDAAGKIVASHQIGRFVLNQDTGGAIKGPGRVDLFFGRGKDAELSASHLKGSLKLYFLIPK